jgi:hypothetical protein
MGHSTDADTIRQRFDTEWPLAQPTVQHTFGDVDFTPPENAAWVRLYVLPGTPFQVSMGKYRRFRRPGVVMVQIFVPAGRGDGLARELADSVAAIFQGRTVNGVIFRVTGLNRVGVDGAWVQWNAATPYQADDLVLNPTP